jgi:TonB-linked SusC/RagA family outer membrane protein
MQRLLLFVAFQFLSIVAVAQTTGTVLSSEDGLGLPGVSVIIQGTSTGTTTNIDGQFSITAKPGDTLRFSFVGFKNARKVVGAEPINFTLELDSKVLEDVVVTALGVSKEKKSLGYAVTEISTKQINTVKEANVVNSLSGKVAGVQVSKTSGGPESSSRIVLRGASSLQKDNQPLFVVDGVPIDNNTFGGASQWGGVDYGSPISDINPEDIESMTVLKGPNAAALYGSRAANGVILITTKKGTSRKGIGVSFNSTTTFEMADIQHKFQNEYGAGQNGKFLYNADGVPYFDSSTIPKSWGPKMEGQTYVDWDGVTGTYSAQPDNYKDFFELGHTLTNSVALDGGNEHSTFRLSYTNLLNKGIVPNSKFERNSVSLRTTHVFAKKLSADFKVNYVRQEARNRQNQADGRGAGRNFNYMPRNISAESLSNYEDENGNEQVWNTFFSGYQTNPYWMAFKNQNNDSRDRVLGKLQLKYDIFDWLFVSAGTGLDMYFEKRSNKVATGSDGNSAGSYWEGFNNYKEINSDFLIAAKKKLSKNFSGNASFGGNMMIQLGDGNSIGSNRLAIADFYNPTNVADLEAFSNTNYKYEKRINAFYGTAQLDFRSYLFLDVTARNDWSSALPVHNNSYFYPSVNLSFVFSEGLKLENKWFSFGKIRGSWAQVGSDGSAYLTTNSFQPSGAVSFQDQPLYVISQPLANKDLKPEFTTSWEAGMDLSFFVNRIQLDLTYYHATTDNQIAVVPVSSASGFNSAVTNAGSIQNQGVEILLNVIPVKTKKFTWNASVNFSKNISLVKNISTEGDIFPLAEHWGVTIGAEAGEAYGNIYGYGIQRDDAGNKLVDENGFFVKTNEPVKLGNYQPDWLMGISNGFTYQGITLSFLVDIKQGGQIYSASNMYNHGYAGTVEQTLEGRSEWYDSEAQREAAGISSANWTPTGGYQVEGVYEEGTIMDGEDVSGQSFSGYVNPEEYWYQFARWTDEIHEPHVYDAGYVKLREVYLGYKFPERITDKLRIQDLEIGIVGRNLWLIHSETPNIDPEAAYTNSNGQGVEYGTFPISRSIGFNLKFRF